MIPKPLLSATIISEHTSASDEIKCDLLQHREKHTQKHGHQTNRSFYHYYFRAQSECSLILVHIIIMKSFVCLFVFWFVENWVSRMFQIPGTIYYYFHTKNK